MKKRWILLLSVLLGLIILVVGLLVYIYPKEKLTMDYTRVQYEEKFADIVRRLEPEIILNESDINAIIKSNLDTQLNEQLVIEGAHFTVGDQKLYAKLNVKALDAVKAEWLAVYLIEWKEPELRLIPVELKVKQVSLPTSVLKEIAIQIYDTNNAILSVERLSTIGNELVIRLKFNLFR